MNKNRSSIPGAWCSIQQLKGSLGGVGGRAAKVSSERDGHAIASPLENLERCYNEIVLITRYGGLGDLIMILPTLKYLRSRHPQAKFVLRTHRDYLDYIGLFFQSLFDQVVLDDNRFLTYQDQSCWQEMPHGPVVTTLEHDLSFASQGDKLLHYNFHGVIERNRNVHGVRSFAKFSGLDLGSDVIPSIPNPRQMTNKRIIQLRSVGDTRDLVESELPQSVLDDPNVYLVNRPLSAQEYVDIIGSAGEFIGPDSSGLHLAAALGVRKIMGLYTEEFPPAIRAYPGVQAFTDRKEFLKTIGIIQEKA